MFYTAHKFPWGWLRGQATVSRNPSTIQPSWMDTEARIRADWADLVVIRDVIRPVTLSPAFTPCTLVTCLRSSCASPLPAVRNICVPCVLSNCQFSSIYPSFLPSRIQRNLALACNLFQIQWFTTPMIFIIIDWSSYSYLRNRYRERTAQLFNNNNSVNSKLFMQDCR